MVFPVYRTYGTGDSRLRAIGAPRQGARARRADRPAGRNPVVGQILAWLEGTGPGDPQLAADAVRRFQQLSAPIAAKAVEDTAFYRYGALLSRNEVGFDPARSFDRIEDFTRLCRRARAFPRAMLATATHDHKRGEDVRARLAVLSDNPGRWRQRIEQWERSIGEGSDVDAADRYMLYQTLFGAWPERMEPATTRGFAPLPSALPAGRKRRCARQSCARPGTSPTRPMKPPAAISSSGCSIRRAPLRS